MSIFQANEEKAAPSGSAYLQAPYLGPVKAINFERKKVGSKEDCFVAEMKLLGKDEEGTSVEGIIQNYIEWNPMDKDEEKQMKSINRLAYFASHFVPSKEVLEIKTSTWEEYVDKIIQLLKSNNATEREDIVMKFTGSVYNGKPSIGTVGYHSFIANGESGPLTFSRKEREGNQKYLEVVKSKPDSPESSELFDDLGFDEF